ncbi:MAG TPA: hypothetical protein PK295_03725 [Candidatus Magasanikbacteria bacterium]|nr:hypothetical protein [Candidatus Magasanikbacteria bacterium]
MELFATIVGWIGTFLIVLAYILVSLKKVEGNSTVYQMINLFGALGVGINVFYQQAWPALALEVVWGIIAIVILVKKMK